MDWIKYSTLLALFLTLGLIFWSFQDPVCINSSVVRKIDIESSSGLYSFLSCAYQDSANDLDLPNNLRPTYSKIEKDIAQFEVFKDQLDSSFSPKNTFKIVLTKPQKFEWSGHELQIGIDLFESEFGFRRALVQAWLKDYLRPDVTENKILFETVTDIYELMIWAHPDKNLPETNMQANRWLDDVFTEESLCRSGWQSFDRQMFCDDLRAASENLKGQIKSLDEVSPWSLRPLLVKDFWRDYKKMSSFEKLDFINTFSLNLLLSLDLSAHLQLITDMSGLDRSYKSLSERMFSDTKVKSRSTLIDFYVVTTTDQFNIFQFDDLINVAMDQPNKNILIRNHDHFLLLPSLTRVRVGYAQPESKLHAHVSCRPPVLDHILAQNVKSGRVLFVQKCDNVSAVELADYMLNGVEAFSEKNKESFMIFHIPSLKIAKETWKLNTKTTLGVKGPDVSEDLKIKLFGWSEFKPATLYKTKAALPIVEWVKWE